MATVGNVEGGAVFVAGTYWVGSPESRAARAASRPVRQPATASPAGTEPAVAAQPA